MVKIGIEKPTSQRNIVAGLIARKDNVELVRHVEFMAFEIIEKDLEKNEVTKFKKFKSKKITLKFQSMKL